MKRKMTNNSLQRMAYSHRWPQTLTQHIKDNAERNLSIFVHLRLWLRVWLLWKHDHGNQGCQHQTKTRINSGWRHTWGCVRSRRDDRHFLPARGRRKKKEEEKPTINSSRPGVGLVRFHSVLCGRAAYFRCYHEKPIYTYIQETVRYLQEISIEI